MVRTSLLLITREMLRDILATASSMSTAMARWRRLMALQWRGAARTTPVLLSKLPTLFPSRASALKTKEQSGSTPATPA